MNVIGQRSYDKDMKFMGQPHVIPLVPSALESTLRIPQTDDRQETQLDLSSVSTSADLPWSNVLILITSPSSHCRSLLMIGSSGISLPARSVGCYLCEAGLREGIVTGHGLNCSKNYKRAPDREVLFCRKLNSLGADFP